MPKVLIGTSGWMYGHWKGLFYPEDLPQRKWLEYFSSQFSTVEINSTFYHAAKPQTFENWAGRVPKDFVFAVKASRFLSHTKKLDVPIDSIKYQLESVKPLGKKLGPILFQFPRWSKDEERLERFLLTVRRLNLSEGSTFKLRMAFEFRHKSWFCESVYKILRKYNCALVIAESGGYWPCEEVVTGNFVYLRFHGVGYSSKYSDKELEGWAKKIKKWKKEGLDVYGYFNNDANAYAVDNAKKLIEKVS